MTDRYALFGNPVRHSKSPTIYRAFAHAARYDIDYGLIEPPLAGADGQPSGFVAALREFRDSGARGGNVTAPFKLEACAAADETLERAALAGAANCLKFERDGRIRVEMFDGLGLVADIERNLGFTLRGRRVLVLGAGGAVRGALAPFLDAQPAALVVANRSAHKARDLARAFEARGRVSGCGYDELRGERFDLVVNGTSASLRGELPAIPASVYVDTALAYDMTYGKGLTPFLSQAQRCGVRQVADGVGMLVEQAAEAWAWWYGVRPGTRTVIDQLAVALA